MGEIGRTLGLGGPPKQTDQPLAPMAGDDDMVSRYLSHWGASGPQPPNSPPTQAAAPDEQPINIEGWKPHHRTTLGFLADALISGFAHNRVTPFADKADRQNMQEAMEGFTSDPEHTIQRIAKFNPKLALALQEKYTDNEHARKSQERLDNALAQRNDDYMYNYVASMMQSATPDNWNQFREAAIQRASSRDVDVSNLIPKEYDPDSIAFIRSGAVKVKDQNSQEERTRHDKTREGQMQEGVDERERHNQATESTSAGRLDEGRRHNRVTEGQGQQRINQSKNAKPKVVNTPRGPMELSPSGLTGKIGDQVWQKSGTGQWKRIK